MKYNILENGRRKRHIVISSGGNVFPMPLKSRSIVLFTWHNTQFPLDSRGCNMYLLVNSLSRGRCGSDFIRLNVKLVIHNSSMGNRCDIALMWMPLSLTNGKQTFGSGSRFTNGFSIAIQIRWKFRFTLTSILIQWSLQNFAHGTTAVLSWHVQKFVAIWWPATALWQGEVSIEFELRAKNR